MKEIPCFEFVASFCKFLLIVPSLFYYVQLINSIIIHVYVLTYVRTYYSLLSITDDFTTRLALSRCNKYVVISNYNDCIDW